MSTKFFNQRCVKLILPYEGPYVVNNENGVNSYELMNPNTGQIRGIFHISHIYKFHEEIVLKFHHTDIEKSPKQF